MTTGTLPNPLEAWKNYTERVALHACRLQTADLKRLYRIINEKQIEAGEAAMRGFFQTKQETVEQFEERKSLVRNAFITTIRIKGFNDQVVTGHGEAFFDSPHIPEKIQSIEYDTTFSPQAQLKHTPNDRIVVFLDFSRPPWLDLGTFASAPTPNNSNWSISAQTEGWSTSLSTRLKTFFEDKQTRTNWLHGSGIYDLLLLLAGVPLSLWGSARVGEPIAERLHLVPVLQTTFYIYLFFLCLLIFRSLFSYGRWVFPKIELASERSSAGQHRVIWFALILGILGSALWDGIKLLI